MPPSVVGGDNMGGGDISPMYDSRGNVSGRSIVPLCDKRSSVGGGATAPVCCRWDSFAGHYGWWQLTDDSLHDYSWATF